jgi:hypothetical protein
MLHTVGSTLFPKGVNIENLPRSLEGFEHFAKHRLAAVDAVPGPRIE